MKRLAVAVILLLAFIPGAVGAQPDVEQEKIAFLIDSVAQFAGAKFIRNGTAYDGKRAAEHLRLKLEQAGSRVRTADDFIRLCASQSSITGKPYLIQAPDGTTRKAEEYFRDKLKAYQ